MPAAHATRNRKQKTPASGTWEAFDANVMPAPDCNHITVNQPGSNDSVVETSKYTQALPSAAFELAPTPNIGYGAHENSEHDGSNDAL